MMRHTLPLAITAALILAACGSGSSDEQDSTDEKVAMVYQPVSESMSYLPQLLSFAEDRFEDAPYEVTYNAPIINSGTVAQMVAEGRADISILGGTGPLSISEGGRSVEVIGTMSHAPTAVLTLRNDVIAEIGVSSDAPYEERVAALKGLTLATQQPGSTVDILLRSLLEEQDIDPDSELTIQPLENQAALVNTAREGQADGYFVALPAGTEAVAAGWGTVWIDFPGGDVEKYANMPYGVIVANSDFLTDHPDEVRHFLETITQAQQDIVDDDSATRENIKAKYFPDMDEAAYNTAYDVILPVFEGGTTPNPDGYDALLELFNSTARTPSDLTFEEYFNTDFITE